MTREEWIISEAARINILANTIGGAAKYDDALDNDVCAMWRLQDAAIKFTLLCHEDRDLNLIAPVITAAVDQFVHELEQLEVYSADGTAVIMVQDLLLVNSRLTLANFGSIEGGVEDGCKDSTPDPRS